jgi:catechol 2,3-dioxygenase-like lactoylglutathione lyase family enzyme
LIERTFQHFALVAADMHRAVLGLEGIKGWRPISASGPQRLPAASGGVTAYKLRDPDGHPLEILEFPAAHTPARWRARPQAQGILGIDHSAISIADTAVSVAFYRALGLTPTLHTLNQGPEQAALDDIAEPLVEVTALRSPVPDPHLELLCYRSDAPRGAGATAANDVAATRITVAVDPAGSADDPSALVGGSTPQVLVRDPDGHRLHLIPAPTCGNMRASP